MAKSKNINNNYWTNSQKKGVYIICFLIVILFSIKLYKYLKQPRDILITDIDNIDITNQNISKRKVDVKSTFFRYNPKYIREYQWIKFGLSSEKAKSIVKYFDTLRVYFHIYQLFEPNILDSSDIAKVIPYLKVYPPKTFTFNRKKRSTFDNIENKKAIDKPKIYGINTIHYYRLLALLENDTTMTKRVLNYKRKLGGYIDTNQIKDVYGINKMQLKIILKNTIIDTINIKKININTSDYKTLIKHPYLDKIKVKSILNFRRVNLKFETLEILQNLEGFTQKDYNKVIKYLEL